MRLAIRHTAVKAIGKWTKVYDLDSFPLAY